ncbi:amino acid ABC transporter ATP-binding protein [Alsobacter sp. R-9]
MTGQCLVEVERVCKQYHHRPVLTDVTLDVHKGECVVLCGPSGSGKSTLLRCVNGLEDWHGGEIRVDGFDIAANAHRRGQIGRLVGMVFQDFNLFPHLTVLDNVSLGPRVLLKKGRQEAVDAARDLLSRVGITEQADKFPHELSGGQQQRVAIARSLAMQPQVMLFDEPTSALDPEMVKEVLDVMRDLAKSGMTMICVTHEMGFARNVADRVVFLTGGCVCETAKPCDFFSRPSTPEASRFLSTILHS